MTYTLKLNDGTVISDLTVNGNNLVCAVEIEKDIFDGNLEAVIVSDGTAETTYHNLELVAIQKHDDGWYIALRQLTDTELKAKEIEEKINSMVSYNEMQAAIMEGVNEV